MVSVALVLSVVLSVALDELLPVTWLPVSKEPAELAPTSMLFVVSVWLVSLVKVSVSPPPSYSTPMS